MTNQDHIELVKAVYAAFGAGDVEALLDLVADDISFELPEMDEVPLDTVYRGKEGIRKFMADRDGVLQYTDFQIFRFFSDQDHVFVLGETAGIVLNTEKPFRFPWLELFEITQDNRVRRFREFLDSHKFVAAFA